MKSTVKLIKRFISTLILSLVVLLFLNIILMITVFHKDAEDVGGWGTAKKLGEYLEIQPEGGYELAEEGREMLSLRRSWAVLVQDGTGDVIWHSEHLPENIPLHYSAAEISWYTRGYIADYPTTTAPMGDDLIIVGNPKDSYWKELYPTFSLAFIKNLPRTVLLFAGANLAIIFIIYMIGTSGVVRSLKPIIQGLEALPEGQDVYVKERGLLSELAGALNVVSEKLRNQEYELKRKEQARANWISGVSHDIRTPLSMVMGYAAEIEDEEALPAEIKQKAGIIRLQSVRMKNLVGDLNLASKLEYNMQPVKMEPVNLAALLRETAVYFMNLDLDGRYPAELMIDTENTGKSIVLGDKELLKRAVYNLLFNAQIHNPEGCSIRLRLSEHAGQFRIVVEDDGVGVSDARLWELQNTPHYMFSSSASDKRHGLGLLLVQQIAAVHSGTVSFESGEGKGFLAEIRLNRQEESDRIKEKTEEGGVRYVPDTDYRG